MPITKELDRRTIDNLKSEAEYRREIYRPINLMYEEIMPILEAAEWAIKNGFNER